MKIWVDADACPVAIKEILYKAAERTQTDVTLVANQYLRVPKSGYIHVLVVESELDAADEEIVKVLRRGDLVITSDIPLASEVIQKGAEALSPRGELYSAENIGSLLNMRDFMHTLRASDIETNGPAALNSADRNQFANHLNHILSTKV
ncbi:MAG: YaiI/YqxD family protein [Candidatus Latescibacterota bacterium]|nr:YaiI/YqxD family protein [Candidatus Latescibacterota bacterium]